ncbi:MAG: DinB family protein [Candidatus Dormibacteria bacterium]
MRIEDADLSSAHLHSPNLERLRITDGWLRQADISGDIEGLVLNGVLVAPLVEAELERQFPERALLHATDRAGLLQAWEMLEARWGATVRRARELPEPKLQESVDHEWSFVETLRHLIMATDCWLGRMVKGQPHPCHPFGIAGSWLTDPRSFGLDPDARPNLAEVLQVRRGRMKEVQATIQALTTEELERVCRPPATVGHPTEAHTVLECLHVILDEEWLHNRYATRDLEALFQSSG